MLEQRIMINQMQISITKVWDAFLFYFACIIKKNNKLKKKFLEDKKKMSCLFCEKRSKDGRINFKTLLNNVLLFFIC